MSETVSEPSKRGADPAVPTEEFVQLFTRTQRPLYLYILSMVSSPSDADEILQETNVVIWSKFQNFKLGTNFKAWAREIARLEIMKHRDRRRRDKLQFSDEFVQQVAQAREDELRSDVEERRRRALARCLDKLRPQDRELIQLRYRPGESGKELAAMLGRPANSVYQSLGRIRRALLECIKRELTSEVGS